MSPNWRADNYIIHGTDMSMMAQNPLSLQGQNKTNILPTAHVQLILSGKSILLPESGVKNYLKVYNIQRETHFKCNLFPIIAYWITKRKWKQSRR